MSAKQKTRRAAQFDARVKFYCENGLRYGAAIRQAQIDFREGLSDPSLKSKTPKTFGVAKRTPVAAEQRTATLDALADEILRTEDRRAVSLAGVGAKDHAAKHRLAAQAKLEQARLAEQAQALAAKKADARRAERARVAKERLAIEADRERRARAKQALLASLAQESQEAPNSPNA